MLRVVRQQLGHVKRLLQEQHQLQDTKVSIFHVLLQLQEAVPLLLDSVKK
jgi:hypothetical protein